MLRSLLVCYSALNSVGTLNVSALQAPACLTASSDQTVGYSVSSSGIISAFTFPPTTISTLTTLTPYNHWQIAGCAVDGAGDTLYLLDSVSIALFSISTSDPTSPLVTVANFSVIGEEVGQLNSLVIDVVSMTAYIGSLSTFIYAIDLTQPSPQTPSQGANNPYFNLAVTSLALSADRTQLYFSCPPSAGADTPGAVSGAVLMAPVSAIQSSNLPSVTVAYSSRNISWPVSLLSSADGTTLYIKDGGALQGRDTVCELNTNPGYVQSLIAIGLNPDGTGSGEVSTLLVSKTINLPAGMLLSSDESSLYITAQTGEANFDSSNHCQNSSPLQSTIDEFVLVTATTSSSSSSVPPLSSSASSLPSVSSSSAALSSSGIGEATGVLSSSSASLLSSSAAVSSASAAASSSSAAASVTPSLSSSSLSLSSASSTPSSAASSSVAASSSAAVSSTPSLSSPPLASSSTPVVPASSSSSPGSPLSSAVSSSSSSAASLSFSSSFGVPVSSGASTTPSSSASSASPIGVSSSSAASVSGGVSSATSALSLSSSQSPSVAASSSASVSSAPSVSSTPVASSSAPVVLPSSSSSSSIASVATSSSSSSSGGAGGASGIGSGTGAAGGSAVGDPLFSGFQGQSYQVHGIDGAVYNVLSQRSLSINGRFVFLDRGDCPVLSTGVQLLTNCWSHAGSYFGALSFRTADGDRVVIEAGAARHGLAAITVNGRSVDLAVAAAHHAPLAGTTAALSVTVLDSHSVVVACGNYELRVDNSDRFLNLASVRVADWARLVGEDQPHGLLGQTWTASSKRSSVRARLAGRSSVSASDVLEGDVDEYVIASDDLLDADFPYSRFVR